LLAIPVDGSEIHHCPHQPAVTNCKLYAEARRPVWTPSSALGKPFPTRQLPIKVWGIGAFKFKGIAGTSKVSLHNTVRAFDICLNQIPGHMTDHATILAFMS